MVEKWKQLGMFCGHVMLLMRCGLNVPELFKNVQLKLMSSLPYLAKWTTEPGGPRTCSHDSPEIMESKESMGFRGYICESKVFQFWCKRIN